MGDASNTDAGGKEKARPFVNESNVIMYLDMVHEKIIELKGVKQYMDFKVNSYEKKIEEYYSFLDC